MKFVFHDIQTRTPYYTAELPEGFTGEAVCALVQYQATIVLNARGSAFSEDHSLRLYFRTGESYSFSDNNTRIPYGGRDEEGTICHAPCDAGAQIDEFAAEFAGQPLQALHYMNLPQEKADSLRPEEEESFQTQYESAMQVLSMQPADLVMQVQARVFDGGTGVYRMNTAGGEKTLLVSLWRFGMQSIVGPRNAGIYGGFAAMARPVTMIGWRIPMVIYLLSDTTPDERILQIYNHFVETLQPVSEFQEYCRELDRQNLSRTLHAARTAAERQQAEINYAWQVQQAGWARSEALSRSISADLDSFRSGLNQRMADYDALHAPGGALYSSGAPSESTAGSNSESMDDRIQRLRHESMMGVNTYVDGEGRESEFSTQADRVFQNNLDNNARFGTEHYYDDYVPEGWSELFRKQ